MKNDAPIDEKEQEQETPKSLLEELIREGARRLLQAAIEQEVTEYLERFRNRRMAPDRRSVKLTARYTRRINFREGWRGHLWQGRFASYAMEERYLLAAARYIEMNPVRAGLVDRPGEYPWSSAAAHTLGRDDRLVKVSPLLELVDDWGRFIGGQIAERDVSLLRRHERTGRPLGGESFIDGLERALSRRLRKQKPGPKPNQ